MKRPLAVAMVAAATLPCIAVATPARAGSVPTPGRITSVTAVPGPKPGQVTFRWAQDGRHTTAFALETGLSTFRPNWASLPDHGRHAKTFTIPAGRRSVTLTSAQTAAAGAKVGSANHLYYRFRAVNRTRAGTAVRRYGYLKNVAVQPVRPASSGTRLRVASFNVRTSYDTSGHAWLGRVGRVASTIAARHPGVVTLQELGSGRADGNARATGRSTSQATSLVNTLRAQGAGRYELVRETRFVKPGTPEAIQGARILVDTSRYRLVRSCPDSTPGYKGPAYSSSCTIRLPLLSGDPQRLRRHATYAFLADWSTGERFVVVSAHLDQRHSGNAATERRYEALRASQVRAITTRVDRLNTAGLPVVFGGDINTYQNRLHGYDAHRALMGAGYYDTAAAARQIRVRWTTMNHFARTMPRAAAGWGSRLDVVAVKGFRGALRWQNVMKVNDPDRASDHNMVVVDVRLPAAG